MLSSAELHLEHVDVTDITFVPKTAMVPPESSAASAEVKVAEPDFRPSVTPKMSMTLEQPQTIDEVHAVLKSLGIDPADVSFKNELEYIRRFEEVAIQQGHKKTAFKKMIRFVTESERKQHTKAERKKTKQEKTQEQKAQELKAGESKAAAKRFEGVHSANYQRVVDDAIKPDIFKKLLEAKGSLTPLFSEHLDASFCPRKEYYIEPTDAVRKDGKLFLETFFANDVASESLFTMYRKEKKAGGRGNNARCISFLSAKMASGRDLCFVSMSQGGQENLRGIVKKHLIATCEYLSTSGKTLYFCLSKDPSKNHQLLLRKFSSMLDISKGDEKACAEGPIVSILFKLSPYSIQFNGILNVPFYFYDKTLSQGEFKALGMHIPPIRASVGSIEFSNGKASCVLPLKENCENCAKNHDLILAAYMILKEIVKARFSPWSKLSLETEDVEACNPLFLSPLGSPMDKFFRELDADPTDEMSAGSRGDLEEAAHGKGVDISQQEFSPGDSKSDSKAESKSSPSKEVSPSEPKLVSKDDFRADDAVSSAPQAFFGARRQYGQRSAERLPARSVSPGPGDSKSSKQAPHAGRVGSP